MQYFIYDEDYQIIANEEGEIICTLNEAADAWIELNADKGNVHAEALRFARLRNHCDKAAAKVATWPEWKQRAAKLIGNRRE